MGEQKKAVAIVGAGFSGLLTAIHIMRQSGDDCPRVYLVDKQPGFGTGIAYSTNNPSHLLNTRAGNMSVFPDEPGHFLAWAARDPRLGRVDDKAFVSRKTYGDYLQFLLREASTCADAAGRLYLVPDEAVALERANDGYILHVAVGRKLAVGAVVIATGNPPPHPPSIKNRAFLATDRYAGAPWGSEWLDRLPRQQAVLLLGTGLTMIDVLLSLSDRGHEGAVYALSRRGLLPRTHKDGLMAAVTPPELPSRLSEAVRAFRMKIKLTGADWRDLIDALRPLSGAYWQSLDLETKRRFLRHLRPWWDVHRHRLAPEVAARVAHLRAGSYFQLLRGRIKDIAGPVANNEPVVVSFRPHAQTNLETLAVHAVVNCMGPGGNPEISPSPFIQHLLKTGLARSDALGLGLDVDACGAIITKGGEVARNLFAVGPPTRGSFWEITAVPDIRVQAQDIAKFVLLCLDRSSERLA